MQAKWRVLNKQGGFWQETMLVFGVFYGCPFDTVLGQGFLEETNAFVQNAAAMIDVFTDAATAGLNLVI